MILIVIFIATSSIYQKESPGSFVEALTKDGDFMTMMILLLGLGSIPVILYAIHRRRSSTIREYLALKAVPLRKVGLWSGILLATLILLYGAEAVFKLSDGGPDMRLAYASADYPAILLMAIIILGPIAEEIVFRGFLFRGFLKLSRGHLWAVVVSTLTFAGLHTQYGPWGLFQVALLGGLFGLARLRTGSLYTSLALHALLNLVATSYFYL